MMRLDFDESSIAQPSSTGACTTDYFQVIVSKQYNTESFVTSKGTPAKTGKATPLICGENAGQHIYVDAGDYSDSSATFALTLTGSTARKWKIKV